VVTRRRLGVAKLLLGAILAIEDELGRLVVGEVGAPPLSSAGSQDASKAAAGASYLASSDLLVMFSAQIAD
jgi:hypothetical protein